MDKLLIDQKNISKIEKVNNNMSTSHKLLKSKVNHEYFAEVTQPRDPIQQIYLQNKTVNDIRSDIEILMAKLKREFPEYVDFYYKYNYTNSKNGCYEAWFDLYGIKEL